MQLDGQVRFSAVELRSLSRALAEYEQQLGAGRVSGRFYGALLRDQVFDPLGMTTAQVISEEDIVPNRAAGYRLVDEQPKNQEWVAPKLNTTADGSLYLSLQDLIALDRGIRTRAVLGP